MTTQQLVQDAIATASTNGTATFVFLNVPSGWAYTGSLFCAGAPGVGAIFSAVIGSASGAPLGIGTPWGTWGGQSVYGPVQAVTGQVLAVTATGLSPGVSYTMSWRGTAEEQSTAQPISPLANTSASQASLADAGPFGGGATNLKTDSASVLSNTSAKLIPGGDAPARLWNWGYSTTGTWPLTGGMILAALFSGLPSYQTVDALDVNGDPASSRISGLTIYGAVPVAQLVTCSNESNQTVTFFVVYSPNV
jgi:hypothetical protein